MPGAHARPSIARFGQFELDIPAGRLFKRGLRVKLCDKSCQLLILLLDHAGEVVAREELRRRLWPDDVFVDFDNNLNITVAKLRRALSDRAGHPRFIETIPKHGYRFLVKASESAATARCAPRVKIVVLPFLNLSGDPAQEYFCDAVTDEVITALAAVAPDHLAVIARTTATYYKGRHKDVAHIRRELGVDYLVEGGLRCTERQVAINIQLIQTSDQTHLFARKYTAPPHDIFDLENCVAQAIAAHVPEAAGKIRAGQSAGDHAARKPTEDLVAYNLYLLGRQQMQQCAPDPLTAGAKAKRYLLDAITRDPKFALGHSAVAEGYWWLGFLGLERPKEVSPLGVGAARRAIELDPSLGYPHALLGSFHNHLGYDWAETEREMALALKLEPGNPEIRWRYADGYLMPQGRIQEAVAELERALESDPLSKFPRFWLGYAFYLGREYARALEHFQFLIELAPDQHVELRRCRDLGYVGLGLVRQAQGRFDEAVSAFRKAVELSAGMLPLRFGALGAALAQNGQTAEARSLLESLEAKAAGGYFPATAVASIHFALGDIDAGFTWLERAVDEGDPIVVKLHTNPTVDPLRSHPRFAAFLSEINLQA